MKKAIYILAIGAVALGCQPERSYKTVRQEVITLHDELMADEEKVMAAKMALDTLLMNGLSTLKVNRPEMDTAAVHTEVKILTEQLNNASNQMSKWMEDFKPEVEGKSNQEAIAYFEEEKVKVKKLDSLYKTLLLNADTFFKKLDIKPGHAEHDHSQHM